MKSPNSLILYKAEQKLFDHYPKYEKYQRRDLFVTTKRLDRQLAKINSATRPYFFVLYVYFKTHNKFYDDLSPKDLQRASLALPSPLISQ
jgi:hypothetical protein